MEPVRGTFSIEEPSSNPSTLSAVPDEDLFDLRRIKMSMVITLIVMIPISVAYGFMNMNCGDAGLKALKQEEHLHVIDDLDRLNKFQSLYGLESLPKVCEPLLGQIVEVTAASLGDYGYYYVSVRSPGSTTSECHMAPPCLTELWCGRGAMIPTNLGMMLAVIVAIFVLVLGILDLKHQYFRQQQILESLGNNTAQIYRMIVSGRAARHLTHVTYGPNSLLRWMAFKNCPWVELAFLVIFYLIIVVNPNVRMTVVIEFSPMLTAIIPFALILCLRFGLWIFCVIKYSRRAAAEQTFDIAFCTVPENHAVCVIYRRFIYWFCNIGNLPLGQPPPNMNVAYRKPMVLVRSQLLAHRSDPDNDESAIVGWSLKMCCGNYNRSRRGVTVFFNGWSALWREFPVDPARIHDLQRWLMDPIHRDLFRYEGVALRATEILPWDNDRLHDPLRQPHELEVPQSMQLTKVFSLRCVDGNHGQLTLYLTTMAGEELAPMTASGADLVADLCYRVSVEGHEGFQVKVALPNGQTLDSLDPKKSLSDAFRDFMG